MKKLLGGFLSLCILLSGLSGFTSCNEAEKAAVSGGTSDNASKAAAPTEEVSPISACYITDESEAEPSGSGTFIKLTGKSAAVTGNGAGVTSDGGVTVTITKGGKHTVTGTLDNGRIVIDADKSDKVTLTLDGADIKSDSGPAILVESADKLTLVLAEKSENKLTDSDKYTPDDNGEPNACLFSKDDLVIKGTGALTVNANYNDGITGKDDVKISGGNLTVTSVDDGITGKDSLVIKDCNIKINAGGDGLRSTNDTDADCGVILIESGTVDITATNDGVQAFRTLQIEGGVFNIKTGGGSSAGSKTANTGSRGMWGSKSTAQAENTSSAKALKCSGDILITGGVFDISSADDSVHANNSIQIDGGSFTVSSGDDGIHADMNIAVNGGVINILKSYEGIEASNITIAGGSLDITASDDGINIAGGNDSSSIGGRPGENSFKTVSGNMLKLTGGSISVNADGDGIDINGSGEMTGGTVIINGPVSDGNGALDYDGSFNITGGTLIAAGSAGMAMAPSDGENVNCVSITMSTSGVSGDIIKLICGTEEIISFLASKQFRSVVIVSPLLETGKTYTAYINDTSLGQFTVSSFLSQVGERFQRGGGMAGNPGGRKGNTFPF